MVLTDDQRALQETARRFAREQLLPDYQKREKAGVLDRDLLRQMGELGLMGVDLPEEYGGLGQDGVTAGLIAEELAYGDFNVSAVPVGISLNAAILIRHAKPEVIREWVPRMIRGEAVVAICLTEPRGGSDASNLQLRARRVGDHYVINGEKTSITFADRADAYLIFARTGTPEQGAHGVSAFFIPYESTQGISRTKFDDVGSHIIGRGSVFFDDVKVPVSHMLGDEGKGFTQVMQGFDYSRALIGLQCCGAAQASLDEAWAYTKEREAFGRPIGQFQGVT
ncbi:MAG TPA: acyl-CoA dehydrogenase family protein, partial [Ramlibacter sp.]|nr:acyl-CoA dehydrogenase family protein [Ramlibacter sp.]